MVSCWWLALAVPFGALVLPHPYVVPELNPCMARHSPIIANREWWVQRYCNPETNQWRAGFDPSWQHLLLNRSLTDRRGSVDGPGSLLVKQDLEGCTFEVVMMDTRRLPLPGGINLVSHVDSTSSMTKSVVLNLAYAARHRYRFTLVQLNESEMAVGYARANWHRVAALP